MFGNIFLKAKTGKQDKTRNSVFICRNTKHGLVSLAFAFLVCASGFHGLCPDELPINSWPRSAFSAGHDSVLELDPLQLQPPSNPACPNRIFSGARFRLQLLPPPSCYLWVPGSWGSVGSMGMGTVSGSSASRT